MTKFEQKQRNAEIFAEKNYYDNKAHNLEVEVLNLLKKRAKDAVMIDHLQVQLLEERENHDVTRNDKANLINKVDCNKLTINALKTDVENLKERNASQVETMVNQAETISSQEVTVIAQMKELEDRRNQYQALHKEKSNLHLTIREQEGKLAKSYLINAELKAELDKLRGNIH